MEELQQLQEFEIPTGREALRGNHSALLRVADYCEDNYVKVGRACTGPVSPQPLQGPRAHLQGEAVGAILTGACPGLWRRNPPPPGLSFNTVPGDLLLPTPPLCPVLCPKASEMFGQAVLFHPVIRPHPRFISFLPSLSCKSSGPKPRPHTDGGAIISFSGWL